MKLSGKNHWKATAFISSNTDIPPIENGSGYGCGIYVYAATLTINSDADGELCIDKEIDENNNKMYGAGIGVHNGANLTINGGKNQCFWFR